MKSVTSVLLFAALLSAVANSSTVSSKLQDCLCWTGTTWCNDFWHQCRPYVHHVYVNALPGLVVPAVGLVLVPLYTIYALIRLCCCRGQPRRECCGRSRIPTCISTVSVALSLLGGLLCCVVGYTYFNPGFNTLAGIGNSGVTLISQATTAVQAVSPGIDLHDVHHYSDKVEEYIETTQSKEGHLWWGFARYPISASVVTVLCTLYTLFLVSRRQGHCCLLPTIIMMWIVLLCGLVAYIPSAAVSVVSNDVCNNNQNTSATLVSALASTIGCQSPTTGVGALMTAVQDSALYVTKDICYNQGLNALCDGSDAAFACTSTCSEAVQNSTTLIEAMIEQSTSRTPMCQSSNQMTAYTCSIQECARQGVSCGLTNIKAQAQQVVLAYKARPSRTTIQYAEAQVQPVSTCSFINDAVPTVVNTLCGDVLAGSRIIAIGSALMCGSLVLALIAAMLSPLKKQPVDGDYLLYQAIPVGTPVAGSINYDGPVYGTAKVVAVVV